MRRQKADLRKEIGAPVVNIALGTIDGQEPASQARKPGQERKEKTIDALGPRTKQHLEEEDKTGSRDGGLQGEGKPSGAPPKPREETPGAPRINIARGTIEGDEEKKPPAQRIQLPIPPTPPYAAQEQPEENPAPHRLYALAPSERAQTLRKPDSANAEMDKMAQDLLPVFKKINAQVPANEAGREELPAAIGAAHSQMTSQAGAPAQGPAPAVQSQEALSRSEQRRQMREAKRQGGGELQASGQGRKTEQTAGQQQEITFQDLLGPTQQTSAVEPLQEKPKSLFAELEATGGEEGGQKPAGLFAQLAEVSGGKPAERKESVVQVTVEKQEPLSCPTCKSADTRVVFCPYCGTGMCANCSPSIKPEGDFFVFTCPHCGEEVNVKRRPPMPSGQA